MGSNNIYISREELDYAIHNIYTIKDLSLYFNTDSNQIYKFLKEYDLKEERIKISKEHAKIIKSQKFIGKKFNKLTVIREGEPVIRKNGRKRPMWVCRCDCGNYSIVDEYKLVSGGYKKLWMFGF